MSLHINQTMIVSNGINGSDSSGDLSFILADKDMGPVLVYERLLDNYCILVFCILILVDVARQCMAL